MTDEESKSSGKRSRREARDNQYALAGGTVSATMRGVEGNMNMTCLHASDQHSS